MPKRSAGILMYRMRAGRVQVFLIHPGGPFWTRKDHGAWSIPKGQLADEEDPLDAAKREFQEETGFTVAGDFVPLEAIRQASGKIVRAWAIEGDCDPAALRSNTFGMEWPPRSGQWENFPEADRGEWFDLPEAQLKILTSQRPLLEQLRRLLVCS
jgi:predicted NUDIX family NTP pyrophosphohydrolase